MENKIKVQKVKNVGRKVQTSLAHATEDGKRMKQIEIAKKLLERKMPIEDIQEITLLTKEEIEKLIINDK